MYRTITAPGALSASADLRVLFSAAAGARRGFGHLVRCRSLARALGVRPLLAIRGGRRIIETALALGCDVVADSARHTVLRLRPDVLVVDDPVTRTAAAWISAGRRAGCFVVSVHDLGLGCLEADLVIDGSVTRNARASRGDTLAGPAYAILDPALGSMLSRGAGADAPSRKPPWHDTPEAHRDQHVLIALGGGPRAKRAAAIAAALTRIHPSAAIRVVDGFLSPDAPAPRGRISWVGAPRGLATELAQADVAIVGGGVSLYEACALGVPAVVAPVVRAQEPTVAAFVNRRAALGTADTKASAQSIAACAARLLQNPRLRWQMSRTARTIVDGRGAERVAAAIALRLVQQNRTIRCR